MPITDYIEVRCAICRSYLTDLDGIWECQEGCGGYCESIKARTGKIIPHYGEQFQWVERIRREYELYNNDGKLIGGEIFGMT